MVLEVPRDVLVRIDHHGCPSQCSKVLHVSVPDGRSGFCVFMLHVCWFLLRALPVIRVKLSGSSENDGPETKQRRCYHGDFSEKKPKEQFLWTRTTVQAETQNRIKGNTEVSLRRNLQNLQVRSGSGPSNRKFSHMLLNSVVITALYTHTNTHTSTHKHTKTHSHQHTNTR